MEALDICVVGRGACTAVGSFAEATAAAVRAGISGFKEELHVIDDNAQPVIAARATYVDNTPFGVDRFVRLAISAFWEALTCFAVGTRTRQPVSVLIGTPSPKPGCAPEVDVTIATRDRGGRV